MDGFVDGAAVVDGFVVNEEVGDGVGFIVLGPLPESSLGSIEGALDLLQNSVLNVR